MSNIVTNMLLPGQPVMAAESIIRPIQVKEGPSFSHYVEQKSLERSLAGKNMLGVTSQEGGNVIGPQGKFKSKEAQAVEEGTQLLQQLILELKELVKDNREIGAGEWQLPGAIPAELEALAESAGMDPAQIELLNLKMDENQGVLPLLDFFSALEKHFIQLQIENPVTAPETDLPLLQTFLEKLGVPVEQVARVSEASINDLGEFDLAIFLKGLEALGSESGSAPISLSEWETEQFQGMLRKAGLSEEMQRSLFPKNPAIMHEALKSLTGKDVEFKADPDFAIKMNLGQLKNMLRNTIADADAAAPKVDMPAVLVKLEEILGKAGFKEEGVGWSPAVQKSVTAIFQELQNIIDHARIRIDRVFESQTIEEQILNAWQRSGKAGGVETLSGTVPAGENDVPPVLVVKGTKDLDIVGTGKAESLEAYAEGEEPIDDGPFSPKASVAESTIKNENSDGKNFYPGQFDGEENGAEKGSFAQKGQSEQHYHAKPQGEIFQSIESVDSKSGPSRMRMSPEMRSFTLEYLSQTVLRGLKNDQHHLAITLYPKELGEVKVDLQVRDNHVSLSFLMENPKVKELLEGSMQEFKNSMEQRGFVLDGCDVSVDQNSDGEEYQKQLDMARGWRSERERRAALAEITELLASGQSAPLPYHEGAVNMMV